MCFSNNGHASQYFREYFFCSCHFRYLLRLSVKTSLIRLCKILIKQSANTIENLWLIKYLNSKGGYVKVWTYFHVLKIHTKWWIFFQNILLPLMQIKSSTDPFHSFVQLPIVLQSKRWPKKCSYLAMLRQSAVRLVVVLLGLFIKCFFPF